MTIKAKFAGHCKLCGEEWEKDFDIFYSKDPRAICINEKCFNDQKKTTGGNFVPYSKQEIVTVRPNVDDDKIKRINASKDILLTIIAVAHDTASDLYPELDKNTNTFGQIRSKLADQLIAIYDHINS